MFVWLVFVCLLFPDGNPQLCLRGFQVPSEHFIALAWVLILFPSPCFMTATFLLRTENNCQKVSVLFWSVKGGANLCFDATRFTPGLRVTCEASVPEATILFSSIFFFSCIETEPNSFCSWRYNEMWHFCYKEGLMRLETFSHGRVWAPLRTRHLFTGKEQVSCKRGGG